LLLLRNIVFGTVPAFHHDWVWPYLHVGFGSVVSYGSSAWLPNDLGAPNLYPTLLPLLVAEGALLQIFSTHLALVLLLLGLYVFAASGVLALARRAGVPLFWATIAGAFYMVSPALYTELVAGHLGDIVVYAALPWVVAAFLIADGRKATFSASLATVCCSVQPQGFIIAAGTLIVCALWLRTRNAVTIAGFALLAACASSAAMLYGLLSPLRAHAGFIAQEHAIKSWEYAQSSSLLEAVAGRGYFAGYDHVRWVQWLYPYADWLSLALIVGLCVCAALRRDRAIILALCTLFVVGVLTLSGLNGPLGGFWGWAFANVEGASVFRELFHAAPLVALPIAIAVALVPHAACRRWGTKAAMVGAVSGMLFVFFINANPALYGTAPYLHGYTASTDVRAFYALLRGSSDTARFAVFPGRQPYVFGGDSGVDPLSYYPIGRHRPIFGYFPSSIVAFAGDRWLNGSAAIAFSVYRRLGVRYLLIRRRPSPSGEQQIPPGDRVSGVTVHLRVPERDRIVTLNADPLIRAGQVPLVMGGDFIDLVKVPPMRIVAFLRQRPEFLAHSRDYEFHGASEEDTAIGAGCTEFRQFRPSWTSASPNDAWVDGARYGIAIPQIDDALDGSVVTSGAYPLGRIEHGSLFLSLTGKGGYRWGAAIGTYNGIHAVAGALDIGFGKCRLFSRSRSLSPPRIVTTSLTRSGVRGTFISHGSAGAFAFEENYDSGWSLLVDGRAISPSYHFVADGYGNGWIVDVPAGVHVFVARYDPSQLFAFLLIIELFAWVVVLGGCAVNYVL
jgi:hypothetical protein